MEFSEFSSLVSISVLLASFTANLTDGASCSDGFDDVLALAIENWTAGGKQTETQVSLGHNFGTLFNFLLCQCCCHCFCRRRNEQCCFSHECTTL